MTYDVNGRLGGMSGSDLSLTASYGVAGEMLGLSYGGSYYLDHYSETRTYNAMLQLTHVTVTGTSFSTQFTSGTAMDMQYIYTAGQNNGRIVQAIDGVAGETVNYTYDALNRLATAGATNGTWGQAFAYDGFGNLTGKTVTQGSAPTLSVSFDPLTNHQNGQSYDANGNPTGMYLRYDVENRMIMGPGGYYAYDHAGKRVKKTVTGAEEFYFYGINGKRLATTVCTGEDDGTGCQPRVYDVYFGGKLVRSRGALVATDRLGSVRASSTGDRMTYYPYGEERTSTADGRDKFGTYMRDSVTQDYADQRYYAVGMGRFNVPDPYKASGGARDPGSWNRYAYVQDDPINSIDPKGLNVEGTDPRCVDGFCSDGGDGSWWDGFEWIWPTGGGGGGGAAPDPYHFIPAATWQTNAPAAVKAWDLAIAASLAAAFQHPDVRYPAYLDVQDECVTRSPLTGALELERNYVLNDQYGSAMGGSFVEYIAVVAGTHGSGPTDAYQANDWDFITPGSQTQYNFYQTFVAKSSSGLGPLPVFVRDHGVDYGTLAVQSSFDKIVINGVDKSNIRQCGTHPHDPKPQF
jgi:RHS repeat-associated protein